MTEEGAKYLADIPHDGLVEALEKKTREADTLRAQLARLSLLEPILKSILLDKGGMSVDINHLAFTKVFRIHIDGKPLHEFLSASDIDTQDTEIRVSVHHIDEEEQG